jgi:hypothetical protein
MDVTFIVIIIFIFLIVTYIVFRKVVLAKQKSFIANYEFPEVIKNKINEIYPHLSSSELQQVMRGLRDYFYLIHMSNKESVAMPSQVVDVAWHEFILFTREYTSFCSKAFGRFIHHTPAEAMKSQIEAQIGIKRAWELSCSRERINHFSPNRLSLIFALDSRLNIQDGFNYELNCMSSLSDSTVNTEQNKNYCAGHISISADFAPSLNGKAAVGGRGCSGGGDYSGGCSGCSGGGD